MSNLKESTDPFGLPLSEDSMDKNLIQSVLEFSRNYGATGMAMDLAVGIRNEGKDPITEISRAAQQLELLKQAIEKAWRK